TKGQEMRYRPSPRGSRTPGTETVTLGCRPIVGQTVHTRPQPARLGRMRIVVPAGGIGGARFLRGLKATLGIGSSDAEGQSTGNSITVIGNTGDDITLFGLRVCPDLDSVMYTLGGGADEAQGWGLAGETWNALAELRAYGEDAWFGLGDRDLATHVVRTRLLREGAPLSEATRRLCERWDPGVALLPMSDQPCETHVELVDGRTVHFQEWWVRLHARVPARRFVQ